MRLSKNFTLEELTFTNINLPNNPEHNWQKEKLLYLAIYILQPIRDKFGVLTITSGYRSFQVNEAVGGSLYSQHLFGEAADFTIIGLDKVYEWIVLSSGIKFGQCIRESKGNRNWIHISLPRLDKVNMNALVYDGKSYKMF